MSTRKVLVITCGRTDYGLVKPIMKEIQKSDKLELNLLATGMHLVKKFGYTYKIIEKDGFKINSKVKMYSNFKNLTELAESLGKGIRGMARSMKKIKPDFILIVGDRDEHLAAALAAFHMNIVIAHGHGGDKGSGTCIDNSIRAALTSFAHIHFAASGNSAERLKKVGEQPERIYNIGAPGVDNILNANLISKEEIMNKLGLNPNKKTIIVLQHPVNITGVSESGKHIQETMDIINELKEQTVIIYPNCDMGHKDIIEIIEKNKDKEYIKVFKALDPIDFVSLMKHSCVLVGNSSCGLIEAPALKLPVVDIGIRQKNREKAENVIHVEPKKDEIKLAIEKCLYDEKFLEKVKNCKNPFGNGTASKQIVNILENTQINDELLSKKITH